MISQSPGALGGAVHLVSQGLPRVLPLASDAVSADAVPGLQQYLCVYVGLSTLFWAPCCSLAMNQETENICMTLLFRSQK